MAEEINGKIEEAVKYASSSNGLENNGLTQQEMNEIIEDIETGVTDETFVDSVVKLVKTYNLGENNKGQGEQVHGWSK